jgi:hypothetical protein
MTAHTPLSGRDTSAAFKGLLVGFVAIALVVLAIVFLTNRKFEGHEPTPAAATP